jgi:hypothetical protein
MVEAEQKQTVLFFVITEISVVFPFLSSFKPSESLQGKTLNNPLISNLNGSPPSSRPKLGFSPPNGTAPPYAYALMIGGVNLEDPSLFRGYIYNLLVAAKLP